MPGTRICKTNARPVLKSLITLLQIIIAYALLAIPQVGMAQTISNLAGDPQGGIGFNRAHWATSINKMIVAFGTSGPGARGDNSVRAFDPVTNLASMSFGFGVEVILRLCLLEPLFVVGGSVSLKNSGLQLH